MSGRRPPPFVVLRGVLLPSSVYDLIPYSIFSLLPGHRMFGVLVDQCVCVCHCVCGGVWCCGGQEKRNMGEFGVISTVDVETKRNIFFVYRGALL